MRLHDIIGKVRACFDWTPVAVSEPVTIYRDYRDKGRVILGYEVTVTYKHHGERNYLFSDDEDKMCIVSRAQAYKNAVDFYHEKLQKIR